MKTNGRIDKKLTFATKLIKLKPKFICLIERGYLCVVNHLYFLPLFHKISQDEDHQVLTQPISSEPHVEALKKDDSQADDKVLAQPTSSEPLAEALKKDDNQADDKVLAQPISNKPADAASKAKEVFLQTLDNGRKNLTGMTARAIDIEALESAAQKSFSEALARVKLSLFASASKNSSPQEDVSQRPSLS